MLFRSLIWLVSILGRAILTKALAFIMRAPKTLCCLVAWTALLAMPPVGAARRKAPDPSPPAHPRSVLDPSFDVLLPDPEPPDDAAAAAPPPDRDITEQVLSAAKQLRTVQEAPALVSVIPAEDIRARGYHFGKVPYGQRAIPAPDNPRFRLLVEDPEAPIGCSRPSCPERSRPDPARRAERSPDSMCAHPG